MGKEKKQGIWCWAAETLASGCTVASCFLIDSTPCAIEKRGNRPGGITSRSLTDACWSRAWSQTPCTSLQSVSHRVKETANGVHQSSKEPRNLVCIWSSLQFFCLGIASKIRLRQWWQRPAWSFFKVTLILHLSSVSNYKFKEVWVSVRVWVKKNLKKRNKVTEVKTHVLSSAGLFYWHVVLTHGTHGVPVCGSHHHCHMCRCPRYCLALDVGGDTLYSWGWACVWVQGWILLCIQGYYGTFLFNVVLKVVLKRS